MYKHISCVQNTSFPMTCCLKYRFNFLLRRLSITQHCLHQIIILRLFGKLIQSSKVTTWKNFSIFHFKSFSLKSLCSMFSLWNNYFSDTKGYADKTYIRPTSTKDFTWTLIFKGKINFKSFSLKQLFLTLVTVVWKVLMTILMLLYFWIWCYMLKDNLF